MPKKKDIEVRIDAPEKQILINQIRMEAKINVLTDLVASLLIDNKPQRNTDEFFKKLDDSIKDHVVSLLKKLQGEEEVKGDRTVF